MEERKKVIFTGIIFILIIILGVAAYYLFFRGGKEAPSAAKISEQPSAQVPLEESLKEKGKRLTEFAEVKLDKSDGIVRELAKDLSSHPNLSSWLMSKDLIRKFTAAVDSIANGMSPSPQIDFFFPNGNFKVFRRNGVYYIDPESYHRYDPVADVFLSLNTEECVKLYRQVKPLIQEAYRDLGYPNEDFEKTLFRAIVELLKVPVVEKDMPLKKKVVTYMIADSRLESLSEAQKHLLRMGPENVHIIQDKLREMAEALGFQKERLPQPAAY